MGIELIGIHWVYVGFVVIIIGCMIMRRDTSLVCIAGIFLLGWLATSSLSQSVSGIFNSFIYAITELLNTILIISIIVSMGRVLTRTGINETMVSPFIRLMRSPGLAYWTVGLVMLVISFFFWPSPAVALIGAVLLPAAVRVGLPPLGVAIAMNLFGHGIALSGDFVIQGAPKLTADAAGIPVSEVVQASIPLVLVMGTVTTVAAFWLMRREMAAGKLTLATGAVRKGEARAEGGEDPLAAALPDKAKKIMAVIIPLLFVGDLAAMYFFKLQGGEATALVGGTSVVILITITLLAHRNRGLERTTQYLVEGLQFGFRVFGPVIPIAAFFYLGDSAFFNLFGSVLPEGSQGIVNDLGLALANTVPVNKEVGAVTLTTVGAITGLDGSGFSGISLAGSIAQLFGTAIGSGIATLTALGQIAGIWVGGGTLIPWALIPAAAICGVDPFEMVRRNVRPVVIGLVVTTIVAMFLI
ncbi:Uncharacterised protein [Chlamydia abortus]|uniref:hypothetical protein n=1 Tax=Paenibacillus sp. 32O-W TaxID=1695218 RepID=UPI000A27AF77|nr:hypothetical protein [Paenibacillus sp. 32O-W]SHE10624.1 Uncharacterised protein [Chlamydia abortus]